MKTYKFVRKLVFLLSVLLIMWTGFLLLGRSMSVAGVFPNPHGGYVPGTAVCAKCHSGHTSYTLSLLSSLTQRQTCYTCHDGSNSNYDAKGQFGESVIGASVYSSYHPAPTGIQLCTDCHDPHLNPVSTPRVLAVGEDKVSSGNEVCGKCHGEDSPVNGNDMLTDFVYTPHDTEMPAPSSGTDIKCVGCHVPHGSPNKPLLRQIITGPEGDDVAVTGNNNTLCFGCHTSSSATYAGSEIFQQIKHGTPVSTAFSETSRADFAQGTLTSVAASSLGEITLAGDTGRIFNGSSDKIDCGSSYSTIQNTFTYEFWVKPAAAHEIDTQSTWGTAGTSGQKYAIGAQNVGSTLLAGVGVSVGTNGVSVYEHAAAYMPPLLVHPAALNDWVHIAIVYSNKLPKLYLNGVLAKTGSYSSKIPFPSNMFGYGPYGYYNGSLKDIRFWNYARTPAQILSSMNVQLAGNEAGLVGYWKLNEGSGNVAYDTAATNNGTMTGTTINHYSASGNRISPEFNLPATDYTGSQIQWSATTPASTTLTIDTDVYLSGAWQGWQTVTNGGTVPGIAVGTDMTGGKIRYRVNMSTADQTVTPSLQDLRINILHDATVALPTYPGTTYQGSLCLNCHEPHGKTGISEYRRAEGNQLCINCHDDPSITYPANYSYQGTAAYGTGAHNTMEPTPVDYSYLLSDSEALAWEKSGNASQYPIPSSPGVAATSPQKSSAFTTDGAFWSTGSAVAEGDYNYQMYKFHVNEDIDNIRRLTGTWRGYGEPTAGHLTELLIWNETSLTWETLDSDLLGDPENPGLLSGLVSTGMTDYVDDNNDVYLLAKAEHDGTGPVVSGLSVINGGTSAIFNWTTDEPANSYVYYGTTSGVYTSWYGDGSYDTTHALPVAGLTSATNYFYQIRTTDKLGNQTNYPEQTLHTSTAPSAPTGLTGPSSEPGSGVVVAVNLSWNASIDPDSGDTVSYEVQVLTNGSLYQTAATAATSTSITLDWYNATYTVSWRVRAVDNHGLASAWVTCPTTFPHTGPTDTCVILNQKDRSILVAVIDRINSLGRLLTVGITGLKSQVFGLQTYGADEIRTTRHFSINTDYVELQVSSVDPAILTGYCGTCHAPHGKDDGTGNPIPKQLDYIVPSVCFGGGFGCHSDADNSNRGINISDRVQSTNSLDHHGANNEGLATNGTLECVNCHNPHLDKAEAKVVDPLNKANPFNFSNLMTDYMGAGGEIYVLAKSRHDGRAPLITTGPGVSNLQVNQCTVTWQTDETTVGYVYYGPVGFEYNNKVTSINGQNTNHTAYLTGLVQGTNYHFYVWAQDSMGNYSTSADKVVDSVAPTISGVGPSVTMNGSGATISWTTNEASTSHVDYTPDAIYTVGNYAYSAGNDTLTTSHSVNLEGLVAGTVYHYQVYSEDARGNRVTSSDYTIKMSSSPPPPAGHEVGPFLDGLYTANVTMEWDPSVDPDGDTVQYYAQLSANSTFSPVSSNSNWISGTTWTTSVSNYDDATYYWRVMAKDEWGAQSVWSATYSFLHRGPPSAPSSCPNFYVWDGKEYQFVTDIAGSVVGKKNTSTGKYAEVNPGLPVAIPWNMLQEKNGQYSIKIKSERDEVDFIDEIRLTAIDHPEGTRVGYNDLVRGRRQIEMFTYSANLQPLKKATYFNNAIYTGAKGLKPVDITDLVAKADNREAEGIYGDDNQFTFDLGNLEGAKQIKLVMQGWTSFSTQGEKSVSMGKFGKGVKRAKTFYEILQPDGKWKEYDITHFNGLPKTVVLDLTGQFAKDTKNYVVRLRGMHRPRIDYVGVDISAPVKFTVRDLEIKDSILGYHGMSKGTKDGKGFEYDNLSRVVLTHEGNFTRYGDVRPLLKEVDDKLVVMDSGDEISLNYKALPPPAPGMTRSFILKPWVYYKEFELAKVEPVPFREMDMNKLPNSLGKYPDELKASLAAWNTRVHETGIKNETGFWVKFKETCGEFLAKLTKTFAIWWNSLFADDTGSKENPEKMAYKPAVPQWWAAEPWEEHYSLNTNFISVQVDDGIYSSVNNSVYTINSAGSAIWESSTEPNPSSPGTDASAHAAEISGRDGLRWRTDNYPVPNINDGAFNYQMFKFVVDSPISQLSSFKVFWQGYGEPSAGYNTSLSLWNFDTGQWDEFSSQVIGNDTNESVEKYVDLNPYCFKCHGGSVPTGVSLGSITRNISASYGSDIHGGGIGPQYVNANGGGDWGASQFYTGGGIAPSYSWNNAALPCADCHDVHGSPNVYHLRETLNASDGVKSDPADAVNSVPGADYANNASVQNFCASCHTGTLYDYHLPCLDCHRAGADHSSPPTADDFGQACINCHTHGGSTPAHGRCHCYLDAPAKAF